MYFIYRMCIIHVFYVEYVYLATNIEAYVCSNHCIEYLAYIFYMYIMLSILQQLFAQTYAFVLVSLPSRIMQAPNPISEVFKTHSFPNDIVTENYKQSRKFSRLIVSQMTLLVTVGHNLFQSCRSICSRCLISLVTSLWAIIYKVIDWSHAQSRTWSNIFLYHQWPTGLFGIFLIFVEFSYNNSFHFSTTMYTPFFGNTYNKHHATMLDHPQVFLSPVIENCLVQLQLIQVKFLQLIYAMAKLNKSRFTSTWSRIFTRWA